MSQLDVILNNFYVKSYIDSNFVNNIGFNNALSQFYSKVYIGTVFNNDYNKTSINTGITTGSFTVNGYTTTNSIEVKNYIFTPANGTHSIFFLAGGGISTTTNIIGRLFGTSSNMYLDFNDNFYFRYHTNKNNSTNLSTRLTINNTGIITQNIVADSISLSNISFTYSTLPTLNSTSLGYTINYTNATTTVSANAFVNSAVISVPFGIYMVNAYANITPSSSTPYRLRLAINTVTSSFNDNLYNSTSDICQASVTLKSISYTTILSVATTTNFYFVFSSQIAGNLNGTLNGKFIRIA